MPFQISWIDPPPSDRETTLVIESQRDERPSLKDALGRACELLKAGKAMLTVRRPDGTLLDEPQIRDHCSGKRTIIA
jgi:hypothetical protein